MELILQDNLPHQTRPVGAIADVFKGVPASDSEFYSNPIFDFASPITYKNIADVKNNPDNNLPAAIRNSVNIDRPLGLDIRMETGTGKTYVYTRTIFELHKRYGISKFIIIVPTLPIKAGAQAFLSDHYAAQHFADTLGYDAKIDLCVVTPMKSKKGKRFFPSSVRAFVSGNAPNRIQVLLVNQGLLSGSAKVLSRSDYDQTVLDFYRPYDALRATHPFVIIDEPHKFDKGKSTFKTIVDELAPQCIIRFGATFPSKTIGRGKNKMEVDDFTNLLFDLTAKDAFDQNLIKGVIKEHLEIPDVREEKVKIMSTDKGHTVTVRHTKTGSSANHKLAPGDSLSLISPDFAGISISEIGKNFIVLSNSQRKEVGEEFAVDAYSASYQEQMIRLALKRHFETERVNFERPIRIKTLALFFIDSIDSFRGNNQHQDAWLRQMFERVLAEQIDLELRKPCSPEYADYLRATKENITVASGGYFAKDASESEESIKEEVEDILVNKKKLLSFTDENGQWRVRRFLFSKWTLREGWDNPNVFTIAKLRSSGSDTSKLQEVGRGLRLPVDELGNRISNESFMLNYIIDFTEKDFAAKLVAEINEQRHEPITKLPLSLIITTAAKRGCRDVELLTELLNKEYITDIYATINPSKLFDLYAEYPELNQTGVAGNNVKDRNSKATREVRIRPERYAELRSLWETLNKKYAIFFQKEVEKMVEEALPGILADGVFSAMTVTSRREQLGISDGSAVAVTRSGTQQHFHGKRITYREFLRRANRITSLPITMLHNAIAKYAKEAPLDSECINEASLTRLINKFNDWRANTLQTHINYRKLWANQSLLSALTNADGSPKEVIAQGRVGKHIDNGIPSHKFLYDAIVYDSGIERENVTTDVAEVMVYGKIPRNSIAVPTVAISSFSPDFMYVVKRDNGSQEINIVVESKDVENDSSLRGDEKIKISCAQKFFAKLKEDGYNVHFRKQLKHNSILSIINEFLDS